MEGYSIVSKTTNEISSDEWNSFVSSFNIVFEKNFSVEHFRHKYFNSAIGVSFHAFLMYENNIVGMFSAIPRKYIFKGDDQKIALACDAYILKEHRKDEFFLKSMSDAVFEKMSKHGIHYIISIPNPTAYPYWKFYGGWKDISELKYYVIPLNVSKLIGKYRFLDGISKLFFRTVIHLPVLLFNNKQHQKDICLKKDSDFVSQRYSSNDYHVRKFSNNGYFVYRLYVEENIRTAYLIDCEPMTSANIQRALKIIMQENRSSIDLIMYVGILKRKPFYFFRVPKKKEPRSQTFTGLQLHKSCNEDFYSIEHWSVGLADFDNR